jgi:hypothetical protein
MKQAKPTYQRLYSLSSLISMTQALTICSAELTTKKGTNKSTGFISVLLFFMPCGKVQGIQKGVNFTPYFYLRL